MMNTLKRTLSIMVTLAVFAVPADAQRGGGGGGSRGGGASAGTRSSARTSTSTSTSTSAASAASAASASTANRSGNVNQNTNVNRNTNVNVDRDVNVNVDNDWNGGCCYHDYPVARAAAVTTAVAVTAPAIGSVVYSVPPSCVTVVVNGVAYQQCGSTWYQPSFSGTTTTYIVVAPPRADPPPLSPASRDPTRDAGRRFEVSVRSSHVPWGGRA